MPFRGKMRKGDPRNLLLGWGGMVWPTVPPWRWRLGSQDATGGWDFLKTTGVLFVPKGAMTSETLHWQGVSIPVDWIASMTIRRAWLPLLDITEWLLRIIYCEGYIQEDNKRTARRERANKDYAWGPLEQLAGPAGSPGRMVTSYQVEFDEVEPPGGWPPFA